MQTILGAGGAIGTELAKALTTYTTDIRLVSRNPQRVNATDQLFAADLTDPQELREAIAGSEIVYITIGFPYSVKVWRELWPPLMERTIKACMETGAKLVFFDNIYMYDAKYLGKLTEETPINPPSKKGEVRATIAGMLLEAMRAGRLEALIARSADFYGPSIASTSVLTETAFKPLSQGKRAQWLGRIDKLHNFTYTPDAGKATALLGNTPGAYGQVWHLPTAKAITGKEWIEKIASRFGEKPKYLVASKWMTQLMGLFMPTMKEMVEMLYQYDRDYVFDSEKFERAFDSRPTPVEQGIDEIMAADYANARS